MTVIDTMSELECVYDSHVSYYGKALVNDVYDEVDGHYVTKELYSYLTKVCWIERIGKDKYIPVIKGDTYWDSNTTLRHIKDFLQQEGFPKYSKKELSQFTIY